MNGKYFLIGICLLMLLPQVSADNYTVYVVEEGSDYKFDPEIIKVNIGDNVTFVWVDTQFSHNVVEVEDEDATTSNGGFESEFGVGNYTWELPEFYTTQEGTYEYVCTPHATLGMRGVIVVGPGAIELSESWAEGIPWLAFLIFTPLIGVAMILFFRQNTEAPRLIAMLTTITTLCMSLIVFTKAGSDSGFKMLENYDWAPGYGFSLLIGVDGLSSPMILLTGLLGPMTVMFAWDEEKRRALFFSLLLLMQTAVYGVFLTLDYLMFYVFWELTLIPMFFLIAVWGGENRKYASIKFFIYTFTASVIMLVGFMALYFEAGLGTFSMIEIAKVSPEFDRTFQIWTFAALFIGFAVKIPVVPWHTWLPDAHVQAPTAGSIILAGLMLKLGLYGMIRAALTAAPLGAEYFQDLMIVLAIISILYGGMLSLAQDDLKKLVAYSSVSHMGISLLGIATFTELGLAGAMYMGFAHGILSPGMFMIAGSIHHQVGTRSIDKLGGIAQKQPNTAGMYAVIFLGSLGLPGLAVFISELSVFIAFFETHGYWVLLPLMGMLITAGYHLWALQRSVFGELTEKIDVEKMHESPWYESSPMFAVIILSVIFGIYPHILMEPVTTACYDVLRVMGVI